MPERPIYQYSLASVIQNIYLLHDDAQRSPLAFKWRFQSTLLWLALKMLICSTDTKFGDSWCHHLIKCSLLDYLKNMSSLPPVLVVWSLKPHSKENVSLHNLTLLMTSKRKRYKKRTVFVWIRSFLKDDIREASKTDKTCGALNNHFTYCMFCTVVLYQYNIQCI